MCEEKDCEKCQWAGCEHWEYGALPPCSDCKDFDYYRPRTQEDISKSEDAKQVAKYFGWSLVVYLIIAAIVLSITYVCS